MAACRLPLLTVVAALGAVAAGAWDLTVAAVVLGAAAHGISRAVAIEIGPLGFTRGLLLKGVFLGRTTSMAWSEIAELRTEWCRPGDDTAMETVVRHRDGTTIRFSTTMGVVSYRRCLGDIAARAPHAHHRGLTAAVLAEPPTSRREALGAATTAAALALTIVAMIGLHYVWALGRGTVPRYQEPLAPAATAHGACAGTLLEGSVDPEGPEVAPSRCP
jgi:hypothetical protein